MKKILVATGNPHKVIEFKEITDDLGLDIEYVCPKDFNDDSEPDENGNSYKENSYIKAKYYYDKYHLPTIADDSGIEIDFYDGKPGIYSSRWMHELSYKDKNSKILEEMKDSNNRGASFHCAITYIENDNVKQYEGIVHGHIANKIQGDKGFGYDPIFISDGQELSNGQLGDDFKKKYSHRALALRKWAEDYEEK